MFGIVIIACVLVAINVAIHAAGLALLLKLMLSRLAQMPRGVSAMTWLLIRLAWCLLLLHAAEIAVWGVFYLWWGCLPDAESAFYFSGVTYTTTGYGDVVLARPWRLLGPIEGLTGILMCGLSAGFFFAVLSRLLLSQRAEAPDASGAR